MATGAGRRCSRAPGEDKVDAFSEAELARRPEVMMINDYAIVRTYVRIGLRGVGALAVLWATVVLLGGFVSVLTKADFWSLTFIAFLQAAGLLDALGDDRFTFFGKWIASRRSNNTSSKEKDQHEHKRLLDAMGDDRFAFFWKWIGPLLRDFILVVIFSPVAYFAMSGPIICIALSAIRLRKQDYGSSDGAASQANLKPALNLFYSVSLVHSAICFVVFFVETIADDCLVDYVSQKYGFSPEVLDGYFQETKRMCVNNLASTESWNLMTYGAGLLDSELPEDYALGVRVVTMLIEHDIPIRRMLIRSPRRRILKLIGALVWRSPVEGETRWLAARIVEHIAGDLNLAQFPGALECVSSLLDTSSCHNNGDQEALQLLTGRSKSRSKSITSYLSHDWDDEKKNFGLLIWIIYKLQVYLMGIIYKIWEYLIRMASRNGDREESQKQEEHVDSNPAKGTNEDLILQGLRILENLAHDQHNCTVIYNTKGLVSKIVAPVSSNSLTEDIDTNGAWIQVVDASLEVMSRLTRAPGDTGKEMRRQIADSSNAVGNLEALLDLQSSSSCILELQMKAMEVLAQLFFHGSTSWAGKRREYFIERGLNIFCTVGWMERYLAEEKKIKIDRETSNQLPKGTWTDNHFNKARGARDEKMKLLKDKKMKSLEDKKMKEAKETASRLKEKAGEALAMLCMGNQRNSEAIQGSIDVRRLTDMLDSKTIKCRISDTETVEADMKIGCRISAAVILKHLCPHFTTTDDSYVKEITLKKVLVELLHITTESQAQESTTSTMSITLRQDEHCIEIKDDGQDEHSAEERRLHAALLSFCADICVKYKIKAPDLASKVAKEFSQEDLVGKLKKMVEENSHATPACLAILKLSCKMVEELILDDQARQDIEMKKKIIGTLSQIVVKLSKASKTMAGVESCMLFAGIDGDCYGVPVKPLLSVLVKQVKVLLERRKDELGMNVHAGGQ